MITFILLVVFGIIGIAFAITAFSAGQRRRRAQSGIAAANEQQDMHHPRATPPGL